LLNFIQRDFPLCIHLLELSHSPHEASDIVLGQEAAVRVDVLAEKSKSAGNRTDMTLVRVHAQPQDLQILFHLTADIPKIILSGVHDNYIVDVSGVETAAQFLLGKVIESVQIDIGKELRRQIPNGKTFSTLKWCKKIIVWESSRKQVLEDYCRR
jgi:hypothetical protein